MNPDMDPLAEYIRQNRDTYNRAAIDSQLLSSGYTQEQIEAAWNDIELSQPPTDNASRRRSSARDYVALIFVWLLPFLVGLVAAFLANVAMNGTLNTGNARYGSLLPILNIFFLASQPIILVLGIVWLRRGWSLGRVLALVIVTSLLSTLIISGTCLSAPRIYPT